MQEDDNPWDAPSPLIVASPVVLAATPPTLETLDLNLEQEQEEPGGWETTGTSQQVAPLLKEQEPPMDSSDNDDHQLPPPLPSSPAVPTSSSHLPPQLTTDEFDEFDDFEQENQFSDFDDEESFGQVDAPSEVRVEGGGAERIERFQVGELEEKGWRDQLGRFLAGVYPFAQEGLTEEPERQVEGTGQVLVREDLYVTFTSFGEMGRLMRSAEGICWSDFLRCPL